MAATRSLLAVVALALAPACGSDDTVVIPGDPVGETVAEGHARGSALADLTFDELVGNDFAVQLGMTASILGAIHDGEILVADFASQVVIDADIFDFATDLVLDHEDENFDLDEVVRIEGVGFIPSATADTLIADANAEVGLLRGTPPGEVDFAFVEGQVIMHAQAQILLDELFAFIPDGPMGAYILDTMDMIDDHLIEAENLLATYY